MLVVIGVADPSRYSIEADDTKEECRLFRWKHGAALEHAGACKPSVAG